MFVTKDKPPVVGLAPMDGVTDAAYRYITKKYGNPDLIFTEFTNVVGLCKGAERLFVDFDYSDIERPVIAQIFGTEPEYFYHAARIVAALGYDGVDINMGCPARNVAERGSGAGLIRTPKLAQEIVAAVRRGVVDYFNDGQLTGVERNVPAIVESMQAKLALVDRSLQAANFSVSVKTRIGYDRDVVSEWIPQLTEADPDWISLHGRTLRQLYTGQANWDAIAAAVQLTHLPVIANGDITSGASAVAALKHTGASGVLIGRGSYGNPWVFKSKHQISALNDAVTDYKPEWQERVDVMLEHAQLHWDFKGEKAFVQMRKNFGWYIRDVEHASELRQRLMQASNPEEARQAISIRFD